MGDFHQTAADVQLIDSHLLIAILRRDGGGYSESVLDLDQYIGNNEGRFVWGEMDFSESAEDVYLEWQNGAVPVLCAHLRNTEDEFVPAKIYLAQRIGNRDGKLVYES